MYEDIKAKAIYFIYLENSRGQRTDRGRKDLSSKSNSNQFDINCSNTKETTSKNYP